MLTSSEFTIQYAQDQNKPIHAIISCSDGITDCTNISVIKWNNMIDSVPPTDGKKSVACLAIKHKHPFDILILMYNPYHNCWDREDGDDYACDIDAVKMWALLPEVPKIPI